MSTYYSTREGEDFTLTEHEVIGGFVRRVYGMNAKLDRVATQEDPRVLVTVDGSIVDVLIRVN